MLGVNQEHGNKRHSGSTQPKQAPNFRPNIRLLRLTCRLGHGLVHDRRAQIELLELLFELMYIVGVEEVVDKHGYKRQSGFIQRKQASNFRQTFVYFAPHIDPVMVGCISVEHVYTARTVFRTDPLRHHQLVQ